MTKNALFSPIALAVGLFIATAAECAEPTPAAGAPRNPQQRRERLVKKAADVNADNLNCDRMRNRMMKSLNELRAGSDKADKECANAMATKANNVVQGGACQSTYFAIANVSGTVEKHVNNACAKINEAKAIGRTCDGQSTCIEGAKAKYEEAGRELEAAANALKDGEKKLDEARNNNKLVAEAYRKDLEHMAILLEKAKENPNPVIGDPFNGYTPDSYGIPASELFKSYAWTPDPALPRRGVMEYADAFDGRAETNAPPADIGAHMEDQRRAFDNGSRALQVSETMRSDISGFRSALSQQTSTLGTVNNNLGALDPERAAGGLSRSASQISAASSLAKLASNPSGGIPGVTSGASSTAPAGAGSNSAAPGPQSAGQPASGPGSTKFSVGSQENQGLTAASNSTGTDAENSRNDEENDLVKSFAPIGTVKIGSDEQELRELTAESTKAKRSLASGGSASYLASGSSSEQKDGAAKGDSKSQDEAARLAAGQRSSVKGDTAQAKGADNKFSDAASNLRELLRRRLAERRARGEEVDASRTVEEIMAGITDAAGVSHDLGDAVSSEQGGPQAAESEPLFRRVHHAHKRFVLRTTPHQAGL